MERIFPWQESQWNLLYQYRQQKRMPHAMLLYGENETGKREFAEMLAESLLCSSGDEYPCGECHSCKLLKAGNHPDLVLITPEERGKAIKVDMIRDYIEGATLTPQIADSRVCIIAPADAMNQSASNSLLKTLEEPASENHLLLVSGHPAQLSATIRSRCQKIAFPKPSMEEAVAWLQQKDATLDWKRLLDCGNGLPLRALRFAQGNQAEVYEELQAEFTGLLKKQQYPATLAGTWCKVESDQLLEWLFRWTLDLLRVTQAGPSAMHDDQLSRSISSLPQLPDSVKLVRLLGQIISLGSGLEKRNLNYQIQLEALLVNYTELNA
jgi:DNA polymerase-3 subunit delta'